MISQYGGSGLGLFVSHELAELQGGQIRVESEFKKGSTFAFYVKCRKAEARQPMNTSTSGLSKVVIPIHQEMVSSLMGYRVLLVEDNIVNQRVLRNNSSAFTAAVSVAGHGLEALSIIEATKWHKGQEHSGERLDIVLMDLEMPVMGGLECLRRIRGREHSGAIAGHVPVIVVSANARRTQVEQAAEAGSDEFISKPFRIGELVLKNVRLVRHARKDLAA
jgi:CheY-like chemotaxis protein